MSIVDFQMGAIGSRSGKSGVSSTGENIPQENFDIQVSCAASTTDPSRQPCATVGVALLFDSKRFSR